MLSLSYTLAINMGNQKLGAILAHSGHRLLILSAIVSIILNMLTNDAITLTLSIILVGYHISTYINRSFFKTYLSSVVLGVGVQILTACLILLVLWLFRVDAPLYITYLTTSAILLLGPWALRLKRTAKAGGLVDIRDLSVIAVICLYISIYMVGVYRSKTPDTSFRTVVLRNISFGVDDLSHLNMFKDTLNADKGLLLGSRDAEDISKIDSISYPKMSHAVAAVFANQSKSAWLGSNQDADDYAIGYGVIKSLLFVIATFTLLRSCLELGSIRKVSPYVSAAAVIPLLGFIVFGLVNPFIQEGFFSVWPILMFAPLFILLITERVFDDGLSRLVLLGAITAIVLTSWPVVGVPLCAVLIVLLVQRLMTNRKVGKKMVLGVGVLGVLVMLGMIQIAVQLLDKRAGIGASQLNASGGIVSFPMLYIPLINIGALLAVVRNYSSDEKSEYKGNTGHIWLVIIISLFVTAIGLYNVAATGTVQYFYIKTAYLALAVLCVFLTPYLVNSITSLLHSYRRGILGAITVLATSSLIVSSIFFILANDNGYLRYMGGYVAGGTRHISDQSAKAVDESDPDSGSVAVVINADNKLETYYLSTLTRSLNRFNYCEGYINSFLSDNNESSDKSYYCDDVKSVSITIVDSPSAKDEISQSRLVELSNILEGRGIPVSTLPAGQ